jgi:hypothetical protein
MRFRRTGAALLVLSLALPTLAGCSPPSRPLLALTYTGDRPAVLIEDCAEHGISVVWVYERHERPPQSSGASPTANPLGLEWQVSPYRPTDPRTKVAVPDRTDMFAEPPRWVTQKDTLKELADDQEYVLQGGGRASALSFTLAGLRDLPAGRVLATTDREKGRITTEQDFRERARKSCD